MSDLTDELTRITGRQIIKLTPSGNRAILGALKFAKQLGISKVLVQDQGGWITYGQYAKKIGLDVIELTTEFGIIDSDDLYAKSSKDTVLLVNSMPGYFAVQNMELVSRICQETSCLIINDISGSVGLPESRLGDVLICSCGKWKPIDADYGGFIATDNSWFNSFESNFDSSKTDIVLNAVEGLEYRKERLDEVTAQVKKDLGGMNILHRDHPGLNVVVGFSDDSEKQTIINYCDKKGYEYTLCPKYIRVNEKAVSIEVKRMR